MVLCDEAADGMGKAIASATWARLFSISMGTPIPGTQFEHAIVLYDEVADRLAKANYIHNLGKIALGQNQYADARQQF